jgi:hypothetical protein
MKLLLRRTLVLQQFYSASRTCHFDEEKSKQILDNLCKGRYTKEQKLGSTKKPLHVQRLGVYVCEG